MPVFFALSSLVFVAALLAHEHLHGGVRSHHLLDRPDVPAVSNLLGLAVPPMLGWLLGVRRRNRATSFARSRLPIGVCVGLVCFFCMTR